MKKLFFVLGILSFFAKGYSQSDMTWTFFNLGTKSNNPEDALYWYNKARETAINAWEDTLSGYFPISQIVAYQYKQLGDFDSAIQIDEQSLEKAQIVFGKESIVCADLLHSISLSQFGKYNIVEALKQEKRAFEIYSNHGENTINSVVSLNMIALYENRSGEYERAIQDQKLVVETFETIMEEGDLRYATYTANLAKYYDDFGDYENAVRWGMTSLAFTKEVVGTMHPKYCNALNALGVTYEHMGGYQEAIRLGEEAITIQKQLTGELDPDYSLYLTNLAVSYSNSGQVIKSIKYYEEAIRINKSLFGEKHPNNILPLINLSTSCGKIGEYQKSIEYAEEAIGIITMFEGENNLPYATCLNNIGNCYYHLGKYEEALSALNHSLIIKRNLLNESHPDISATIINISSVLFEQGEYNSAISILEEQAEKIKSLYGAYNDEYVVILNNLAVLYSEIGDPFLALETNYKVLNIRKKSLSKSHPDYLQSLVNISMDYVNIGQNDKALEALQECEENYLASGESFPSIEGNLYNNLAVCYSANNDHLKAIDYYKKALALNKFSYGETSLNCAKILDNIAVNYSILNDYQNSLSYGNQSLEILLDLFGEDNSNTAQALGSLSWMYFKKGETQKAYDLGKKQIKILENNDVSNSPIFIEPYMDMFVFSTGIGKAEEGLWYLQRSMELEMEDVKHAFRHLSVSQKDSYWNIRSMLHTKAQLALFSCANTNGPSNLTEQTYNAILLSKGLLLSSEIGFRDAVLRSNDDVLKENFFKLQNDKLVLNQLMAKPNNDEAWTKIDSLGKSIEIRERQILDLVKDYTTNFSAIEIEFDSLVTQLDNNDVIVEFAENGLPQGGYYAFIIRENWDTPLCIELGASENKHPLSFNEYQISQINDEYYQFVWSAVDNYINEGDDVYFSPDGLLQQLSIEILKDSLGRMACEKYNLKRISSSRQICKKNEEVGYSSAALFGGIIYDLDAKDMVANSSIFHDEHFIATRGLITDTINRAGWGYLSGTKEEIDQIDVLMKSHGVSTNIYSEMNGSEEAFKALSGKHITIIHIATHGFFFKDEEAKKKPYFETIFDGEKSEDANNSLKRSGLIMAGGQNAWLGDNLPDNVEDGVLLAEEIAVMDLSGTDLVVLSACETGLGDITSDGVFGLQRAFKMAGVQTLVMSLWKVDDNATSLMMQSFYEHLLSGMSKREAFNLAQAAVRAKYPEPYYWAGFVMLD